MAIETTEGGGFMITGERDTRLFGLLALRKKIEMEMRPGGLKWRGNLRATVAQLAGTPDARLTNKKALAILNKIIAEAEAARTAEIITGKA